MIDRPRDLRMLVVLFALASACTDDDDGSGGSGDGDGDGDGDDGGVPSSAHCEPVVDWDPTWVDFESEVLAIVNEHRSAGATCGGTVMNPVPALAMDGTLVCAARLHSQDMIDREFFDHTNPDGEDPWTRMEEAGYMWSAAGENIAWGQQDPASVMDSWMNSPGHCSNIMSGDFEEIGIGYATDPTSGPHWTQVFGTPL